MTELATIQAAEAPVLLAGCGIWGRKLLAILRKRGREVLVLDPEPNARLFARESGCSSASHLDDVSGNACAAIVATPASTHADLVLDLARRFGRDLPILCEKPLATSRDDAKKILAATGRLFVDHTWRYHPGVVALAEIARSGVIGTPLGLRTTRTNWTSPRTDVDTVWNLVPHDLTLALEILGTIPAPRAALCEILQERAVGMWALLGGEPWLVLESSNRFADKRREIRLHGTAGVAVLPDVDSANVRITYNSAGAAPGHETLVSVPPGDPLSLVMDDFLALTDGGLRSPKSSAAEGLLIVEVIEKLRDLAGLNHS